MDSKRMQREREGCEPLPILMLYRCPARHLRVLRLYPMRGLTGRRTSWVSRMVLQESLLSFVPFLVCLRQPPTNGERVTFHDVVHEMKEIRHTQALQPLFSKLHEGLCPVTHQVA